MNKLYKLYAPATETGSGQAGADAAVYEGMPSISENASEQTPASAASPEAEGANGPRSRSDGLASQAGAAGEGEPNQSASPSFVAPAAAAAKGTELTAERIQEIAEAVARGMQPVAPQQPQKQLTPQEVNKLLNKFEVNPDILRSLGFTEATPEQVTGFQQFVDRIVQNSTTVANLAIQAHLEKIQSQFNPVLSYVQQAQQNEMKKTFFSKHAELEKYEPIVRSVADTISDKHPNGKLKTLDEAMNEVAAATKKILADSGINLSNNAGGEANHSAAPGNAVPAMKQLAGAGRSSSGGGAGKNNNPDADIYKNW